MFDIAIAPSIELSERSSAEVVQALQNAAANDAEKRELVIEAEAMTFEQAQVAELNMLLRNYIDQYRDSDDPQNIVAVGAAIRKYVATMPVGDLSGVALLLDAGHRAKLPLGLELEICKMVLRKLVANPAEEMREFSELTSCLADIVRVYANDRLLSREKYGATALNAILALVLLDRERIAGIVEQVRGLKAEWFRELAVRRALDTSREMSRRFANGTASSCVRSLETVAAELERVCEGANAGAGSRR
jgi:hypothetical protein